MKNLFGASGATFASLCMMVALLLGIPHPGMGQDRVPAGFDLFETVPEGTQFSFAQEFTIPAGFFGAGCDAFTGDVSFKGLPLGTFMGQPTGTADTVVRRRMDAVVPPPFPSTATIPIELVQLSLASTQPISVDCLDPVTGDLSTGIWDVEVRPSPSRPSTGSMSITKENPDGGTFSSTLEVLPLFTFTRHIDLKQQVLDVGVFDLPPQIRIKITLQGVGASWVHNCPVIVLPSALSPQFCVGAAQNGKRLTQEQAMLAQHGVLPAQRRQCVCSR